MLKRFILSLFPRAFRPKEYDPKQHWTNFGLIYKKRYHRRFERNLKAGDDMNVRLLSDYVEKLAPKSVLDIGCGYGLYVKAFEDRFPLLHVEGCDISPTQLDEARTFLGPNTRVFLKESEPYKLPYKDKEFDLAITYGVCLYLPHDKIDGFINEIARVTKRHYLFIENSRGDDGYSYTNHDYPAVFQRLGIPLTIERELIPAIKERLYLATFE
ncbi:MAG: class I SAM-dependent methyltransferase [Deltaproteobacteria bacterium]|nr:class I SAM-dependent methyltransferase [Deltaproteobacteria bacterium]